LRAPALPGPPLAFAGYFILWSARGFEPRYGGAAVPWILLAATIVVTVVDFVMPFVSARRWRDEEGRLGLGRR
jgi:uncharacterized protein YqgC (DUF456 family)